MAVSGKQVLGPNDYLRGKVIGVITTFWLGLRTEETPKTALWLRRGGDRELPGLLRVALNTMDEDNAREGTQSTIG